MPMGHQSQMPQQQGQSSHQVTNSQPHLAQMSGPLPIQISHGQMGQSAQSSTSQIIPSNNSNAMFQVKWYNWLYLNSHCSHVTLTLT